MTVELSSVVRLTRGQSRCLQTPTSLCRRFDPPCPIHFHLDDPCFLPLLILPRSEPLLSPNQFLLRICRRRHLLDSQTLADAIRIIAFTPGTFPCFSPSLEPCPNRRSRKTAWMFQHRLRRCVNDQAMTVCEQDSGSAVCHPHPTIPSLLHLHLDPALRGGVTTTSIQCPIIFSPSSNQGHIVPRRLCHLDPHQRVPL